MIATTRGLAVLAVLASLLGIAVLVGPGERASANRSLAPQLVPDAVTSITVTHVGTPAVQLVREPDGWRWTSDRALAETATVDAILSTLRGAHWHRRSGAGTAQPVTAELRLDGGRPLLLSRGRDVPGAAQTWIVRGSDALLVDSWVATALFPPPLALRISHPTANASQATAIIAEPLRIEGSHLVAPTSRWLDPAAVARLTGALANLEIVALATGPTGPGEDAITLGGPHPTTIAVVGTCEGGRVFIRATSGVGCVEAAAWQAVVDALAPIRALADDVGRPPASVPVDDIVDRRPLPIEPSQITFGDGTVLSLASPPRIGDVDADRPRVEELVAALTAPGTRRPRPIGAPRTTLTARDAAGIEVVLELFDDDKVIARRGEPVAIEPAAAALAVIARPASALRDPVRWKEDATTLSSLTIGGTTYTRGAVLGEWTRSPAGVVDAALVDALASALAIVRARDEKTTAAMPLSIRVTFTPPAGAPRTHELALGAPTQEGCPGRIDGVAVRADLELCMAAHALAGR